MQINRRKINESAHDALVSNGVHPTLARLFAARGIESPADLDSSLSGLLPVAGLLNIDSAATILADAITDDQHVVVTCDFDVDGCSAGAVVVRAMRMMGMKRIDFAMPNRVRHGYGLSPLLVEEVIERYSPDFIMTVDCGISSFDGIAKARDLGVEVLVTDHHLPADRIPEALCIVNPNQHGCRFASKSLAGVGVAFYVMLAVRAELRGRGAFAGKQEPNLGALLDMVALATVADVVKLDLNNRILVKQGLQRIRNGKACAGIAALMKVANKDIRKATVFDMGFIVGPRLNAAGRMADMSVGMRCLLTDDPIEAEKLATELDATNRERREVESSMKDEALSMLDKIDANDRFSLVLFDESWHQGVSGIVASRIREKFNRPTIVFATGEDGKIKGSGRSITGLHLRDALDMVDKRHPGLLLSFGGHAMAAGMSCHASRIDDLRDAFEAVCRELLDESSLQTITETDGDIHNRDMTPEFVRLIDDVVWGQGFPPPVFDGLFTIKEQRVLKDTHLKLKLDKDGKEFDAIWFFHADPIDGSAVRAIYTPGINEWNGRVSVQMLIKDANPVSCMGAPAPEGRLDDVHVQEVGA